MVQVKYRCRQEGDNTGIVQQTNAPTKMESLRILLAEDNSVNQHLAEHILSRAGHIVFIAQNGKEAISAYTNMQFDLILMDVQMPEMSGLEATQKIREIESETGDHIPIIAATAHALEEDRQLCLDAGMDAYISKPYNKETLLDTMHTLIQQKKDLTPDTGVGNTGTNSNSATPSVDTDSIIVDRHRLRSAYKNEEDLLYEIIHIFLDDYQDYLRKINSALDSRDCRSLSAAMHTLKSALSNLCATSAFEVTTNVEVLANTQDCSAAKAEMEKLFFEFDRLIPELLQIF